MQLVADIRKVTLWGMVINIALTLGKLTVGLLTGSQAAVADAVHSLSDMITDIAVLVGVRFWNEPADGNHPHGHQRIETLVTLFIGAALSAVAIGIGGKAVLTLHAGTPANPGWPVFWVAVCSIVSKEILYQWTARVGRRCKSTAVIANAWHHRSDAFSSLPVAVAALGTRLWPSLGSLDAIATILVGLMLLQAAWRIAWPALQELADTGADARLLERLHHLGASVHGVSEIHRLRTRRVGDGYTLDLHVLVDPAITVEDGHQICDDLQELITRREPQVLEVLTHLEPARDSHLPQKIETLASSMAGVRAVHRIRTRRVLNGYEADLHVLVDPDLTVAAGHRICSDLTTALLAAPELHLTDVLTHLEPYIKE